MIDDYPEFHQQGSAMMHNEEEVAAALASGDDVDFGVQIANDGRVWVCINGMAYLRFKPNRATKEPE